MKVLELASGFKFDYTNLFGDNKVTLDDVQNISQKILAAHQAIEHMRKTGEIKGHLSKDGEPEKVLFSTLPYIEEGNLNNPKSIEKLKAFGQSLRYKVDAVVSFGIGGSYLGNKVLFDVTCGDFWNLKNQEMRDGYPKMFFSGNNIDARRTKELIEQIKYEASMKQRHNPGEKYKVMMIVISKSGSTLDTMSNFMALYDEFLKEDNKSKIEFEVTAVTGLETEPEETLLCKLAKKEGWQMFSVPDGIGGRFSVFSEVGLVTAVSIGMDIDAFLAGARSMDEACKTEDVFKNPALLNAVLKHIASETYGKDVEVFMPYADYLKSVAEWYIQLLAESLGKRTSRSDTKTEICVGRTPVVAVGTTDMHSQTQQHQDGKRDKVVQFIKVDSWADDLVIPNVFPDVKKLAEISSLRLSQALSAALESNAEALISDNRFNATFVLPKLDAFHLGELLYLLALAVAYEGELLDVDAFDQPGVENYKRILGPMLTKLKNS